MVVVVFVVVVGVIIMPELFRDKLVNSNHNPTSCTPPAPKRSHIVAYGFEGSGLEKIRVKIYVSNLSEEGS